MADARNTSDELEIPVLMFEETPSDTGDGNEPDEDVKLINNDPTKPFEEIRKELGLPDSSEEETDDKTDEEEEDTKPSSDSTDNKADSDETQYAEDADETIIAAYKTLSDMGFVDENKDFDGTYESLQEQLKGQAVKVMSENAEVAQEMLNYIISQAPDPAKQLMAYAFTKENVTQDDLAEFFSLAETSEKPYDEVKTIEEAEKFIDEYHSEIPEKARKTFVEELVDSDEDGKTAIGYANKLIKEYNSKIEDKQSAKLAEIQKQQQQEKEQQVKFFNEVQSVIEELDYKPRRKQTIISQINNNKINEVLDSIKANPKAFVQFADLISYYDEKKGFDLTAFAKQAGTKTVEEKKKKIESNYFSSAGVGKGNAKRKKISKTLLDEGFEPEINTL